MNACSEKIPLGSTDFRICPLGIGAWAWGDRFFWGYGRDYQAADIEAAARTCLEAGIDFFDTAEIYGRGQSERMTGQFVANSGYPVVIATKFFPYPWRLRKKSLLHALKASLQRLNLNAVDLYQIHQPYPPVSVETWAEGLADAVEAGLVKAVGVSNYSSQQMRRAHAVLVKRDILLASNQVEYHLLNRTVEKNGLLSLCKELGISLIAYSPLAQGLLTGKYTPDHPLPGIRGRRYNRNIVNLTQRLIRLMHEIGQNHGGKTPSQVALNWVMRKGAIPIPGVKNIDQVEENVGALGWELTDGEISELDILSENVHA